MSEIKKIKTSTGVMYVLNGKLHNDKGPALKPLKGKEEYYLFGIKYSKEKWKEMTDSRVKTSNTVSDASRGR